MGLLLETTSLSCDDCGRSVRVIGKNGTSIPYLGYCPRCGSSRVKVEFEVIDITDEEVDLYGY